MIFRGMVLTKNRVEDQGHLFSGGGGFCRILVGGHSGQLLVLLVVFPETKKWNNFCSDVLHVLSVCMLSSSG